MKLLKLIILASLYLASPGLQAEEGRVSLENTPLSIKIPIGFVLSNSVHTDSPSLYFFLPKGPNGGTPMYPNLSVIQINPIREPESLESYIKNIQSNEHAKVFIHSLEGAILSQPAVEIGAEWVSAYSFADGTSASGQSTRHEIVFSYKERFYKCALEAYPEIHEQWVPSLRELCQSLREEPILEAQ